MPNPNDNSAASPYQGYLAGFREEFNPSAAIKFERMNRNNLPQNVCDPELRTGERLRIEAYCKSRQYRSVTPAGFWHFSLWDITRETDWARNARLFNGRPGTTISKSLAKELGLRNPLEIPKYAHFGAITRPTDALSKSTGHEPLIGHLSVYDSYTSLKELQKELYPAYIKSIRAAIQTYDGPDSPGGLILHAAICLGAGKNVPRGIASHLLTINIHQSPEQANIFDEAFFSSLSNSDTHAGVSRKGSPAELDIFNLATQPTPFATPGILD